MNCDLEEKYCDLKQCLMPSGKVLWLYEEHRIQSRIVIVTSSVTGSYTRPQVEEKSEILKALAKLNERIANDEMPPPTLKVPEIESARRSSSEKQSYYRRRSHQCSWQESTLSEFQQDISEIDHKHVRTMITGTENEDRDEKTRL